MAGLTYLRPERQIVAKLFHGNFIYSQSFCQQSAERKRPKKYFHIFVLMTDLGFELGPKAYQTTAYHTILILLSNGAQQITVNGGKCQNNAFKLCKNPLEKIKRFSKTNTALRLFYSQCKQSSEQAICKAIDPFQTSTRQGNVSTKEIALMQHEIIFI